MQVACPQCGAPVEALTETRYYRCAYCASPFVLHGDRGIEQFEIPHERDDRIAWSALAEYQERNGADAEVDRGPVRYLTVPCWCFTLTSGETRLVPAIPLPEELRTPTLPAGDLSYPVDPALLTSPQVPLGEAEMTVHGASVTKRALIHLPFYLLSYRAHGTPMTAAVSGIDAKVYATVLPARATFVLPAGQALFMAGYLLILLVVGLVITDLAFRAAFFVITALLAYTSGYLLFGGVRQ